MSIIFSAFLYALSNLNLEACSVNVLPNICSYSCWNILLIIPSKWPSFKSPFSSSYFTTTLRGLLICKNTKGKVKQPSCIITCSSLLDIILGLKQVIFKPFSICRCPPITNILKGKPTWLADKPIPPYFFIATNIASDTSFLSLNPSSFNISLLKGAIADCTLGSVGGINFSSFILTLHSYLCLDSLSLNQKQLLFFLYLLFVYLYSVVYYLEIKLLYLPHFYFQMS